MTPTGTTEPQLPAAQRLDLRRVDIEHVVDRVESALTTRLHRAQAVAKRRSLGFRTDRDTWVRIECRGLERLDGQGWGLEAATVLAGVPIPAWHAGISWHDPDNQVMWRADETELIDQPPIGRSAAANTLPDSWWTEFDTAMDALADAPTTRLATPDLEPISIERVHAAIAKVFPDAQAPIEEWTTAHADLNWANMTGPELWILDWEDWGRAPRGLDAAHLWFGSLAVPGLAEKVLAHRRPDLESATGRTMRLFKCAELLAWADDSEPLFAPASRAAQAMLEAAVTGSTP
ncbi:conserved hypothetical protein [Catenulispora acidiphila DSM 44928]|uniref:Aminoglycoside phosphotransferase n=1 Tax=Catenulispora acidiphila (strain DSM 44928 / JCM 14897 / NBRC 102108 / NRRL B-24433 / ID139908) TaxID=479433 RepID=C7Q409_CATAD|nr:hypothetical protein [Catenulispora acidiphila]ACU77767.1 conserved hypothetical protein [Catenulispora acidiphila DSM 44928]